MSTNNSNFNFNEALAQQATVHTNLTQEVLVTTTDKIRLVLRDNAETMTSKRDWITPFGLLLTFIITLISSDFKTTFSIEPPVWDAIFIIGCFAFSIWLLISLIKVGKHLYKGEGTEEFIIQQLKLKSGSLIAQRGGNAQDQIEDKLVIVTASYSAGKNGSADVLDVLRKMQTDGKFGLASNKDLGNIDPAIGHKKKLIVDYTFGDKVGTKEFKENEQIVLP